MNNIFDATTTAGDHDFIGNESAALCDRTDMPTVSRDFVRVVVTAGTKVVRATVDPVTAQRRARIRALNAAIKAGYTEPSASTC